MLLSSLPFLFHFLDNPSTRGYSVVSKKTSMKEINRKLTFPEALWLLLGFVGILMWGALKAKIPTGMSILLCAIFVSTYGMIVL